MTDTEATNDRFSPITNPGEWLVWLDLDDTLWDFRGNSHESLIELYHHLDLNRFWNSEQEWIEHYHRVNSALWALYAPGEISRDTLRHDRFFIPFVENGMSEDEAERLVPEADRYYLERLGRRDQLVPGAKELIDRLIARGFRLGVLSNGFEEVQYNKLRSSGLDSMIDIVVLSDEIDVNKPDIRLFRHAEERASVSASRCIMIGDNPETDILGALKSGWKAIWYNPDNLPLPDNVRLVSSSNHHALGVVSSLDNIIL